MTNTASNALLQRPYITTRWLRFALGWLPADAWIRLVPLRGPWMKGVQGPFGAEGLLRGLLGACPKGMPQGMPTGISDEHTRRACPLVIDS